MLVKEKRDRRVCLRCSKQTGLTQFFHDFYNLDVTLGKRARIGSICWRREAFSARSEALSASTRAALARSRASSISSCTIRSSAVIALF